MEIEKFIAKNIFLYHLTDSRNWEIIKRTGMLLSAESIVNRSSLTRIEKEAILQNRRPFHKTIEIENVSYHLRDQRPISETNLKKSLSNGWTVEQFISLLNTKVFFWPNLKRLWSHYSRYKDEEPIILKVSTKRMFDINNHVEFCRLNSGATRSNHYLGGAPPSRGLETFAPASEYTLSIGSVAEVTFPNECQLPLMIYFGFHPEGPWTEYNYQ